MDLIVAGKMGMLLGKMVDVMREGRDDALHVEGMCLQEMYWHVARGTNTEDE